MEPAGPGATEALLPADPAPTEGDVEMVTIPELATATVRDAVAVQPLRSVTVTL